MAFPLSCKKIYILKDEQFSGKCADPGGTAIPGQHMKGKEQAPIPSPLTKISSISKRTHGPRIRY